ncbi:transcriptional regulator, Crp/Fnr family [Litoreibacter arenae DSM 19593]|uniref:Transcriptional regulator, Crp/Fnr family n=2 Tax=Litoreibacter TaxID=947567 RepID=S9RTB3_9RHOB|nr:transcriptional regulator, Crp/Fnr family [Litoreibacter arenae DSM 19593]
MPVLKHGFIRKELQPGQIVFEQGAENRGLFCISRGLIALRTLQADGTSSLLGLVYPGEIAGVRSFLRGDHHMTEARAAVPSRVCMVLQRHAKQVIQNNSAVLMRVAERCLTEIDRNQIRMIAASTKSNKERLAELLSYLMEYHGETCGTQTRMWLPLPRADLASLIGVQPETLSRLLKRLEKDGTFAVSGRFVTAQSVN